MAAEAVGGLSEIRLNWPPTTDGSPQGPNFRQRQFLACGAREQLYGGSKRGGKTVAGCAKGIYLSYLYPGNRGYILRNEFTDLRDSTLTTFFRLCPPELVADHNKTAHKILLYTIRPGVLSEIIYAGLGEESELSSKAKEKAKAKESGWFLIDEPSEVSFEAFKMMLSQLCWYLPDGSRPPYMALLTSNPEPGWVKDRYVDIYSEDYIIGRPGVSAEFIPSLPSDNNGLPENWEVDLRATESEEWIKRYLDGSWDIHEGMVFTGLSEEKHNLDRFLNLPPSRWEEFYRGFRLFSSLDHASTGITAYLITGTDRSENLCALEEYYRSNRLIVEHAASIRAIESRYPGIEYRLIDPSCESKTLQNRDEMISVQEAYIREGINTIAGIRSHISVGLDQIKTMLVENPVHIHPFTQKRGSPRLFISKSRCPNLWKEMVSLKQEVNIRGEIIYKGRDHAIDDLRYIVMSRPGPAAQKELDIQTLPTLDQVAHRAMESWQKNFGREGNTGSWF